jgi:Flp pilus assembly protein TadD
LSRTETETEELTASQAEWQSAEGTPTDAAAAPGGPFDAQEPAQEDPDLSQARSLLTELRPAGIGEVLVTDVWSPPEAKEEEEGDEPRDQQREWDARQERRQLNLLRERPLVSHDARHERYWGQVNEALADAPQAIVDPYTAFVAAFADADVDGIAEHRADVREYGHEGRALLHLGRAYVAIGRLKSARSVLQRAAKAEPLDAEIWWYLGLSHLFGRADAAAAEALERATDQIPGDFRSELALAVARYHKKEYAGAEDHFRRLAGPVGMQATARSMLACSLRMQGKWDDARVELGFLREAELREWRAMSDQCLNCVERGEQKRAGPLRAKRRAAQMWKALGAAGASGIWILYAAAEDMFRKQVRWATVPLFVLAALLIRTLRGVSGRELAEEFGNAEQGLPCWQATTWTRPRQSEF